MTPLLFKPFDRFFRRDGAGAVFAIYVAGHQANPTFGIDIRRTLRK